MMPEVPALSGCALSCIVVNVNGLRKRSKRRALFQRLRDLHSSIVILCETHSKDDAETTNWTQEGAGPGLPWEGQAFWHHGAANSRGVAILIRAGLGISDPIARYRDLHGRLLMVTFQSQEGHPWQFWECMGLWSPTRGRDFSKTNLLWLVQPGPQGAPYCWQVISTA